MKKLLILAGATVHCKVVRKAKEMGIYTIVTDYLTDSPAKRVADESWMLSIKDVDGIVQRCEEVGIDGVLNYCIDPGQIPYQKICDRLGLPCIGTKEQFDILTDKRKFKDFCLANDVDVVENYNVDLIKSGKVKYPVFVKPAMNRGSRGQYVCWNYDETLEAYKKAKLESGNKEVICERYMKGNPDIATAFFVVDGEPYLIKLGDRILGKETDNLNRQVMCTMLPSVYKEVFEIKIYEKVKNMIRRLGIHYGPVFMQGFFDGDTVRFYDPGFRMPGSDYDLMLQQATGLDVVKSMIHFALTGDRKTVYGNITQAYDLNGKKALLYTVSLRPGRIGKILGYDEVMASSDTVYGFLLLSEGDEVPESGDVRQRAAEFGIIVRDKKEIEEHVQWFYRTFQVLDERGNDMIASRITENKYIEEYYK